MHALNSIRFKAMITRVFINDMYAVYDEMLSEFLMFVMWIKCIANKEKIC